MITIRHFTRTALIVLTIAAAVILQHHVDANGQGGYDEQLNPDGTGWKVHWDHNDESTAQATASVAKYRTTYDYTHPFEATETAVISASQLDSNGNLHRGSYSLWTYHRDWESELYVGRKNKSRFQVIRYLESPSDVIVRAKAKVSPRRDSNTDLVYVAMNRT